jgi:hypothetical protein
MEAALVAMKQELKDGDWAGKPYEKAILHESIYDLQKLLEHIRGATP